MSLRSWFVVAVATALGAGAVLWFFLGHTEVAVRCLTVRADSTHRNTLMGLYLALVLVTTILIDWLAQRVRLLPEDRLRIPAGRCPDEANLEFARERLQDDVYLLGLAAMLLFLGSTISTGFTLGTDDGYAYVDVAEWVVVGVVAVVGLIGLVLRRRNARRAWNARS